MAHDSPFSIWKGTATFKRALYDVEIVAPAGTWSEEIREIIAHAGGVPRMLENQTLPCVSGEAFDLECHGASYRVSFMPNYSLTDGASRRQTEILHFNGAKQRLLSGSGGHLQQPSGALRNPQPRGKPPMLCPTCGTPGQPGSKCRNCGDLVQMRSILSR